MAMNTITFSADNDLANFWDTVNVTANGQPYESARQIVLDLNIGDGSGEVAGIDEGGNLNGVIRVDNGNGILEDAPVFPGYIDIQIGNRAIRVELMDPRQNFLMTRVFMDGINGSQGIEITEDITEIHINIDAISGNVEAYFSYVSDEFAGIGNVTTVTMI